MYENLIYESDDFLYETKNHINERDQHKSYIVSIHEIESLKGKQVEIGGRHLSVGKS